MKKGKLIVIEGTDGSGKATQLKLLEKYLQEKQIPVKTLSFPQYDKTFFGRWIGRFLKGEFGQIKDLPPYLLIFPYAADRWQAREEIKKWLEKGKILISDRYTGSNVYQAAKLPASERLRFISWAFELEYDVFKLPREDLVLFLDVPPQVSQKLLEQKGSRKYLGNCKVRDLHESNYALLGEVEKEYLKFCKAYPHWVKITCTKDGKILSKEIIQQKIIKVLEDKKII